MLLKIRTTLAFLIINTGVILSQQLSSSNQYLVNRHFLSPAYAGINGNFETFVTCRKNSMPFEGAPESYGIYTSSPVSGNMSLGASFSKSSVTIFDGFSAQLDYAYHLKISEKQFIHFGLSFDYLENFLGLDNQSSAVLNDQFILFYAHSFNTGAGLDYTNRNFQFGATVPHMLASRFKNRQREHISYTVSQLIRIHTSYLINLNQSFSFEPFAEVEMTETDPLWYNVSAMLNFKGITWVEFHYQQSEIMGFCLGANISRRVLFNYSYEFSSSGIMKYSSGINEISVGFLIGKNSNNKYPRSSFRSLPKQPYYKWIK
jgi:type IX secretion system PorP/SprF family membrane protein